MATAIVRNPNEPMGDYVSRLAKDVTRFSSALQTAKADNEALAEALNYTEDELQQAIADRECKAKLHPVAVVLIHQVLTGGVAWLEERYAEGKPYVALPGAVVTGFGSVVAYLIGAPQAGDGLLTALNAMAGIMNVRFASRKGAEGRRLAKQKGEAANDKEKANDKAAKKPENKA